MKEISENAKKLLIENLEKFPYAEKQAKDKNSSLKQIIEYFIIKDNIASLRLWGTLAESKFVTTINPDFSEAEKILGFEIHPELKEILSLDFYIEGLLEYGFQLDGSISNMNIVGKFDKSGYSYFKDDFICCGHFCTIGGAVEGLLEFDNDTGAVYFWDWEVCEHDKMADSVREMLLKAKSIWSVASEEELFPLEDLYEKFF
ncbi:MAG: hypothetical protein NC205_02060 [Prevotella sp.]|nr:hypothetical protein [Alistipes senegalensis]MCM1357351.1 hypothetical protein [Prevotella sp.]MCM1474491.1 hypothetical protein [Muribaculaceae bacterium]